jgi:ATP-dependent helicase/nuclease subunit B
MSVRYILGRSGSGKSTVCLTEIRERLLVPNDQESLVLLVPEQATFKAEHALVTSPGISGFMRAQVLSFRRLAFRVMQERGGTARVHISENGKKMLLHKLLHRTKDELKVFHYAADQTGFIDRLNELMVELKRYRIDSEQLAEQLERAGQTPGQYASELTDKLADLSHICSLYEREIAGLYVEAEDDLAALSEQFGQSSYADQTEVWIDGFNGFTPQEFHALSAIMRHAKQVNITLCVDRLYEAEEKPDSFELFHPTADTLIKLRQIAADCGVKEEEPLLLEGSRALLPRFAASPMLAGLEQHLAGRQPISSELAYLREDIKVVSAAHRRAEAEAAARHMLELVKQRNTRWRDILVLVRNMDGYRDMLATAFSDFGIPHFFDQKRKVTHHPVIELIRASLETVKGGWRYDSIFRAIKTGMLVQAASPGGDVTEQDASAGLLMDLNQLENYVLAYGIHGYRWTDGKPWTYHPQISLESDEDVRSTLQSEFLERINRIREQVVSPLRALEAAMKAAITARQMAEAVYKLLEDTHAAEQLERWTSEGLNDGHAERAREHSGIWDSVIDVLDQLVEMMGEETISLDVFTELLETGLDNIKLGLVPPALDQVLIGGMERTRPGFVKHVLILGANDGVLPSAMKEDGILSEQEREKLSESGMQLAPGSLRRLLDEQFMIYTALTTPAETLFVSYPIADDEGKTLLPAEVIRRMLRLFPKLMVEHAAGEPPGGTMDETSLAYMAHPGATLSALMIQLKRAQKGLPIAESWWHAYNWLIDHPKWRQQVGARRSALFHSNQEKPIPPALGKQLYGSPLAASVSRMELFASCGFAHFASYGLRLRERKLYRLEAPDVGQLFHAALSQIGAGLQREGVSWAALSEAECMARASAAVDALTPRLQSEILMSTGRYRYIAQKLKQIVGRAAAVLAEHGRRGLFQPIGLELGFGPNGELPSLSFKLDDGSEMEIVGRIDRVDRAEGPDGQLLRIIDYKSSQKRLNLAEVYYGLSLQILTYLDVVITHSKRWLGAEAKPGGVLYFHVHEPLIRSNAPLSPEAAADELFRRFKMKGLVLADEATVRMMDTSLETGHSTLIPIAMKADGTFYKSASVMTSEQWSNLRRHGRSAIRKIGSGITSGRVDIEPYRMGGQIACTFCSYKSVCHFDPELDSNHYASKLPYKQDEVWELLNASAGELNRANAEEKGGAKADEDSRS